MHEASCFSFIFAHFSYSIMNTITLFIIGRYKIMMQKTKNWLEEHEMAEWFIDGVVCGAGYMTSACGIATAFLFLWKKLGLCNK